MGANYDQSYWPALGPAYDYVGGAFAVCFKQFRVSGHARQLYQLPAMCFVPCKFERFFSTRSAVICRQLEPHDTS